MGLIFHPIMSDEDDLDIGEPENTSIAAVNEHTSAVGKAMKEENASAELLAMQAAQAEKDTDDIADIVETTNKTEEKAITIVEKTETAEADMPKNCCVLPGSMCVVA